MKKTKTPAEIAAHEAAKLQRKKYRSEETKHKRTILNLIKESGLRIAEIQLEQIKGDTNTLLRGTFSRERIIGIYETAIKEYKEGLLV